MSNNLTQLTLFKSHLPSMTYSFKNGKPAHFILGKFATSVEGEIKELNDEVTAGNPYIYIDSNEVTIDSQLLNNPLEYIKRQAVEDYKREQAEQAAQGLFSNDNGGAIIGPDSQLTPADVMTAQDVNQMRKDAPDLQGTVIKTAPALAPATGGFAGMGTTASVSTSANSNSAPNKISISVEK